MAKDTQEIDLRCRYCDGKGQEVHPCGDGTWEPHLCDGCEGTGVDLLNARIEMLSMLKRIRREVVLAQNGKLARDIDTLISQASQQED